MLFISTTGGSAPGTMPLIWISVRPPRLRQPVYTISHSLAQSTAFAYGVNIYGKVLQLPGQWSFNPRAGHGQPQIHPTRYMLPGRLSTGTDIGNTVTRGSEPDRLGSGPWTFHLGHRHLRQWGLHPRYSDTGCPYTPQRPAPGQRPSGPGGPRLAPPENQRLTITILAQARAPTFSPLGPLLF